MVTAELWRLRFAPRNWRRQKILLDSLTEIIAETNPDVCRLKSYFAQCYDGISVAEARTAWRCWLGEKPEYRLWIYAVYQIKQTLTGYVELTKKQVQEMVRLNLGLKDVRSRMTAADALAQQYTRNDESGIIEIWLHVWKSCWEVCETVSHWFRMVVDIRVSVATNDFDAVTLDQVKILYLSSRAPNNPGRSCSGF